jgi:hypothetical protein
MQHTSHRHLENIFIPLVLLVLANPSVWSAEEDSSSHERARSQQPAVQSYWFHQGAEITSYDLLQARYGEQHQGEAVLVYVTEPIDVVEQVKSDNPRARNAVPGFKLNATRHFLTGIYPYSVMQTTLQPMDGAVLLPAIKSSTSIQEWCGHVFEQWNRRSEGTDDMWQQRLFSYFQSEGDAEQRLPGVWLEDELWTRMRLDPTQLPIGDFAIIPGAVDRRFTHRRAAVRQAAGRWANEPTDGQQTYILRYHDVDREVRWQIEKEFPFRLLGWIERTRGAETQAQRRKTIYSPYWQKNSNQHRGLRSELDLPVDR